MVTLEQSAWHIASAQETAVAFNPQGPSAYAGQALKDDGEKRSGDQWILSKADK